MAVTNLGRDEVFIVALALYTLLVNPQGGRNLGVAFAISYLLNTAIKYGFNVPRPFVEQPELVSEAAKKTAGGPSFPSGHAQMATTLWMGIAAQLQKPWLWAVMGVLVAFIAFSRIALNVHRPHEVVVGLVLGGIFAWFASLNQYPAAPIGRIVPPLGLLVAALLPSSVPGEFAAGLGMLAGFWASRPDFKVPKTWVNRLIVGMVGLVVVFAVYFTLGALPDMVKDLNAVRALRYAILVLVVTHGVPMLLKQWLSSGAEDIDFNNYPIRARS